LNFESSELFYLHSVGVMEMEKVHLEMWEDNILEKIMGLKILDLYNSKLT